MFKKFVSCLLMTCIVFTGSAGQGFAMGQGGDLPKPGVMVATTAPFMPVMLKGLKVSAQDPLMFDFLMDTGDAGLAIDSVEFKVEAEKLIKYFLAAMAIKGEDLWVNLSPYEAERIMTDALGGTVLGRDMLAQDYILKQLMASSIWPEKDLGRSFWNEVYSRAQEELGTSDIPVDTFNKVWITADSARVLQRDNAGYVVDAHLKVMLDGDYYGVEAASGRLPDSNLASTPASNLTQDIMRQVIIPVLEREVNTGKNFAPLRQMFYSMILASWYKKGLKDAVLNRVYSNTGKVSGVQSDDPLVKEKIYERYMEAYRQGVFNYVKEEKDPVSGRDIPRKYFSGGVVPGKAIDPDIIARVGHGDDAGARGDMAEVTAVIRRDDRAERVLPPAGGHLIFALVLDDKKKDGPLKDVLLSGLVKHLGERAAQGGLDSTLEMFERYQIRIVHDGKEILLVDNNKNPGVGKLSLSLEDLGAARGRVFFQGKFKPYIGWGVRETQNDRKAVDKKGPGRIFIVNYDREKNSSDRGVEDAPKRSLDDIKRQYKDFILGRNIVFSLPFSSYRESLKTIGETLSGKLGEKLGAGSSTGDDLSDVLQLFRVYRITVEGWVDGIRGNFEFDQHMNEKRIFEALSFLMKDIGGPYGQDGESVVRFEGTLRDEGDFDLAQVNGGIDLDEHKMRMDIMAKDALLVQQGAFDLRYFQSGYFSGVVPDILRIRPGKDFLH